MCSGAGILTQVSLTLEFMLYSCFLLPLCWYPEAGKREKELWTSDSLRRWDLALHSLPALPNPRLETPGHWE